MIKRLEWLKNTVNKYMADIRPDRLTTCQSERKSVVSRRPSVSESKLRPSFHYDKEALSKAPVLKITIRKT
jgi:hypothetical protein